MSLVHLVGLPGLVTVLVALLAFVAGQASRSGCRPVATPTIAPAISVVPSVSASAIPSSSPQAFATPPASSTRWIGVVDRQVADLRIGWMGITNSGNHVDFGVGGARRNIAITAMLTGPQGVAMRTEGIANAGSWANIGFDLTGKPYGLYSITFSQPGGRAIHSVFDRNTTFVDGSFLPLSIHPFYPGWSVTLYSSVAAGGKAYVQILDTNNAQMFAADVALDAGSNTDNVAGSFTVPALPPGMYKMVAKYGNKTIELQFKLPL